MSIRLEMAMAPNSRTRFFIAGFGLVLLLITVVAIIARQMHESAYRDAWAAYVSSRSVDNSDPDIAAFATMGIRYGDTEQEVDRRMTFAEKSEKLEPSSSSPVDTKFVKFYSLSYGPSRKLPFHDSDYEFIHETFWVQFDQQGRAFHVRRYLFDRRHSNHNGVEDHDLQILPR